MKSEGKEKKEEKKKKKKKKKKEPRVMKKSKSKLSALDCLPNEVRGKEEQKKGVLIKLTNGYYMRLARRSDWAQITHTEKAMCHSGKKERKRKKENGSSE